MSDQSVLVIYHAHCADGFTAAWVCHNAARPHDWEIELFPASYGDKPPDVAGRNVEIVDFSYGREDLIRMHEEAESLIVLDHHKSAQANCEGLDFCTFDMEHSGAMLAWFHHNRGVEAPQLVRYIEDRDIWKWELPYSKAISAYISTFEKTLTAWGDLLERLEHDFDSCLTAGEAVLRYQQLMVERIAAAAGRLEIAGHDVPVVNSPILQSELGHHLSEDEPFAAVWYEHGGDDHIRWSLRSKPGGVDVSEVAKQFGGGGHEHAAGFNSLSLDLRIR